MPADGTAFRRVFDEIGLAIVRGELPAGSTISVDRLVETTGASRSVVREVTRVLGSLGLLTARRRVGLRIASIDEWDGLDADIVRWRLRSQHRDAQISDLLELRLAVEPAAARVAAVRRSAEEVALLAAAGEGLIAASKDRDSAAFRAADLRFHRLINQFSGNRMFARLESVFAEALRERTPQELGDWTPTPHDVGLHLDVVRAIEARDPEQAAASMAKIVRG